MAHKIRFSWSPREIFQDVCGDWVEDFDEKESISALIEQVSARLPEGIWVWGEEFYAEAGVVREWGLPPIEEMIHEAIRAVGEYDFLVGKTPCENVDEVSCPERFVA